MKLNKYIDHTKLGTTTTFADIKKLCDEAVFHNFKSVCVPPTFVAYAKELLSNSNSDVLVCTVIGFPHGTQKNEVKAFETREAINDGADEIDMVINVNNILSSDLDAAVLDIKSVVDNAASKCVKVIIESYFLDENQIILACLASAKAGANFVKTSTGYAPGGATVEDVKLMRSSINPNMEVKASGGVRSLDDALKMIEAGATRIGTSNGIAIVTGSKANEGY